MTNRIPGLGELVQVFTKASQGPFHIQAGTVLDAKEEIVAEFATRDDAAAIAAFFSIKEDFIAVLDALSPMFLATRELAEEDKGRLADALIRFKEKIASFEHAENNNVHT